MPRFLKSATTTKELDQASMARHHPASWYISWHVFTE